MKEKIQEILKKYEKNKTEIVLMGIFAVTGLAFGISDYVQKTSSDRVQSVMEHVSKNESGADGASGANGESGADGTSGADGESGADGASGANGESGADGVSGADGESGADGVSGADGESGTDGASGADGGVGAAGTAGADGESGADGKSDMEGEAGMKGETGVEDESGTESRIELEQSLALKLSVRAEDFCIPMLWEEPVSKLQTGISYAQWQILQTYELNRLKYHWEAYRDRTEIGSYLEVLAQKPFSELQEMIEAKVAEYDGEWSVYVKKLSTNENFVINDVPMKSASVMKLFIMGTVYKAFESGEMERTDEIMALMHDMIEYSDNEDSNRLLYLLGNQSYERGIAKVDAFIQEYGFSDMTVEYNGFNDPATNMGTGMYNQVSAKDCGKLLEDIYRRTWVNRAVSNEMEAMLLAQKTRYKIPAGLPEGVLCGNKTGEMDTTENDAAIIYTDQGDYILVVLSSDWGSKDTAIERIRSISSAVYEFLN